MIEATTGQAAAATQQPAAGSATGGSADTLQSKEEAKPVEASEGAGEATTFTKTSDTADDADVKETAKKTDDVEKVKVKEKAPSEDTETARLDLGAY